MIVICARLGSAGLLQAYTRTSKDSLAHTYNGLDDRIATARTPAGGRNADIRRFVTAPDGRVMGEYGSSASDVRAEFTWISPEVGDAVMFGGDDGLGGYMPIAIVTGATLIWVHANHMATPIVITDASGITIAQSVETSEQYS